MAEGKETAEVVGYVTAKAAEETGLKEGTRLLLEPMIREQRRLVQAFLSLEI